MNPRITEWTGRSVWLIGASTGIGLATAQALHAAGARVVVSARQADLLQQFVDTHVGAMAVVLDVTQTEAVHQAAQYVLRHQGLDVVILLRWLLQSPTRHAIGPRGFAAPPKHQLQRCTSRFRRGFARVIAPRVWSHQLARQCGGLPRPSQQLGLRPNQGGVDQPVGKFVLRLIYSRHRCERCQPRFCTNPIDLAKRLSYARLDSAVSSSSRHAQRLGERSI